MLLSAAHIALIGLFLKFVIICGLFVIILVISGAILQVHVIASLSCTSLAGRRLRAADWAAHRASRKREPVSSKVAFCA